MGKVSKALEKSGHDEDSKVGSIKDHVDGLSDFSQSDGDALSDESRFLDGQHEDFEDTETQWDERLDTVNSLSSNLSESFRMLRSRILYPDDGSAPPRTILVTSATSAEGKSFVAANLGIIIAQGVDQHALLIGCDLRKPALAKSLGLTCQRGLSYYLQNDVPIEKFIRQTSVERLSLLPAGRPPRNPAELLGSEKMRQLVGELIHRYNDRMLVFDSPPMQEVSETLVLARQVDGVVLVVRWGGSNRTQVKRLAEKIGRKKILGVVFNGFHPNRFESKFLGDYGESIYGGYK